MRHETHNELAIPDLQRRLTILGYQLGDEAEKGLFGEKTATAVASFKASTGLGSDDVLDQTTWTTIIDASMQMGDRILYLHMPHFRGRDVGELQAALSSMGFSCNVDSVFGPETEQALRDYQANMALNASGILTDETFVSLARLNHIWEGKRGFVLEGRPLEPARSNETLKEAAVCFFGNDDATRAIASRIANLARAANSDTSIASASSLTALPSKDMLFIGLRQSTDEGQPLPKEQEEDNIPLIRFKEGSAAIFKEQLRAALITARSYEQRLVIVFEGISNEALDKTLEQLEIATHILDSLCEVLDKTLEHQGSA